MRNFNNNREINMHEYIPKPLEDVREIKEITTVETVTVKKEWQATEDLMNDQFIVRATEKGISDRERPLKIVPLPTDTLEDRRFRLLTRYVESLPYTRRALMSMLEAICGTGGYEIWFYTSQFTVRVRLGLTVKNQIDEVEAMLERVVPCNMVIFVEVHWNTWGQFEPYTWGSLKTKTWKQMREEVL